MATETTRQPERLAPRVRAFLPIASGKGGVGKSTVSVNLAVALAKTGAKVGLMDADVYGPSIPTLLGITEKPQSDGNRIRPVEKYGVKIISMAFFIPPGEAVIWRGPMLHKMVQDFLGVVDWGELDYLIVDLPPGTGDIQLSLCQSIPVTGAVIVSTPQDVAWNVAQKAIAMFNKLNAPVLGIIENMSSFACSHCGHEEEIFGKGGARKAAESLGIPYLGSIPLVTALRAASDSGRPIVDADPSSAVSKAFVNIAAKLAGKVAERAQGASAQVAPAQIGPPGQPEITIEWTDGKKSSYTPRSLRAACPCAHCVDEATGRRLVDEGAVQENVRAAGFQTVGRYALRILWSDRHDTGLYGYAYLRQLAGI